MLRKLPEKNNALIDFSSNDYLGLARNPKVSEVGARILENEDSAENGATGSRLITGNHGLYTKTEKMLADFHHCASALVFNSGYDANLGFFASVPQRGDVVFYDELIHASIRDGISLGNAQKQKFLHNNLKNLEEKIRKEKSKLLPDAEIYVVTESVFSMDGDSPNLLKMAAICKEYQCNLVVDEAHSVGVLGKTGKGLVPHLGIEKEVFARIVTFGKAIGCHGAAILGSEYLKEYLTNFARSFIYTTGLPPHSLANIQAAHQQMANSDSVIRLQENIGFFKSEIKRMGLGHRFIDSQSAIHCLKMGNVEVAKNASAKLKEAHFDVRAILSPTVPLGEEGLRICLHSFNTKAQMEDLLILLKGLSE
ncbi:aminotransferase class I/II-fold pyridoxal phosphate-dependent enzyme [Euzebyella saccharophila]|uniref:Aminotransferase class I/II-fold pyridoxal phosphate-dependent enzyme n=1 Tax=Euzebyella saccharophila TaxID=679664 RepID=A0ABV8JUS0_9FLAO|nr:pyridoxal phosphate-dependent aminotransferase family protein [Euzebyella saccharophila]